MFANFFIDRPIFAWVIAIVILLGGGLALRKSAGGAAIPRWRRPRWPSPSTTPAPRRRWWRKPPSR